MNSPNTARSGVMQQWPIKKLHSQKEKGMKKGNRRNALHRRASSRSCRRGQEEKKKCRSAGAGSRSASARRLVWRCRYRSDIRTDPGVPSTETHAAMSSTNDVKLSLSSTACAGRGLHQRSELQLTKIKNGKGRRKRAVWQAIQTSIANRPERKREKDTALLGEWEEVALSLLRCLANRARVNTSRFRPSQIGDGRTKSYITAGGEGTPTQTPEYWSSLSLATFRVRWRGFVALAKKRKRATLAGQRNSRNRTSANRSHPLASSAECCFLFSSQADLYCITVNFRTRRTRNAWNVYFPRTKVNSRRTRKEWRKQNEPWGQKTKVLKQTFRAMIGPKHDKTKPFYLLSITNKIILHSVCGIEHVKTLQSTK